MQRHVLLVLIAHVGCSDSAPPIPPTIGDFVSNSNSVRTAHLFEIAFRVTTNSSGASTEDSKDDNCVWARYLAINAAYCCQEGFRPAVVGNWLELTERLSQCLSLQIAEKPKQIPLDPKEAEQEARICHWLDDYTQSIDSSSRKGKVKQYQARQNQLAKNCLTFTAKNVRTA